MEKAEIEGLWTHIHWLSVLEEQVDRWIRRETAIMNDARPAPVVN